MQKQNKPRKKDFFDIDVEEVYPQTGRFLLKEYESDIVEWNKRKRMKFYSWLLDHKYITQDELDKI